MDVLIRIHDPFQEPSRRNAVTALAGVPRVAERVVLDGIPYRVTHVDWLDSTTDTLPEGYCPVDLEAHLRRQPIAVVSVTKHLDAAEAIPRRGLDQREVEGLILRALQRERQTVAMAMRRFVVSDVEDPRTGALLESFARILEGQR